MSAEVSGWLWGLGTAAATLRSVAQIMMNFIVKVKDRYG